MAISKMKFQIPRFVWTILGIALCLGIVWLARSYWRPLAARLGIVAAETPADDHAPHAPHGEGAKTITISPQARKNIGLHVGSAALRDYKKSISIPAIVTERPGRTNRAVASPLTGFVVDVFAVPGQAVLPGTPLFVLELTNEDLVDAQTEFLGTLLALDVARRELQRRKEMPKGVLAQKNVTFQQYEVDKLKGQMVAQREGLRLHGLSESQIDSIAQEHRLLREFLIATPDSHNGSDPGHLERAHPRLVSAKSAEAETDRQTPSSAAAHGHGYVVDELPVEKGQLIKEGETLIVLADYSELYIGGDAFERDAPALVQAAENNWPVSAVLEQDRTQVIEGLNIVYVANEIDPESRTLRFYIDLPNEVSHTAELDHGRVFPTWQYKLGQRIELRVPVARWNDQLVVPVAAVATDGPERYVFVQNGNQFRRQPVHVLHRGADAIVIANDGAIYPGTSIAMDGAHQLQMAVKNQAGGGIDPHAGHTH